VLDELPAELSEQAYMWQWEQGVDGDDNQLSTHSAYGLILLIQIY